MNKLFYRSISVKMEEECFSMASPFFPQLSRKKSECLPGLSRFTVGSSSASSSSARASTVELHLGRVCTRGREGKGRHTQGAAARRACRLDTYSLPGVLSLHTVASRLAAGRSVGRKFHFINFTKHHRSSSSSSSVHCLLISGAPRRTE